MKSLNIFRLDISWQKANTIWLTSDTHYGHKNICRSTSKWSNLDKTRNFESLELMNQHIVDSINSRVAEDDILIHLGDFAWPDHILEFRNQIKCKNIHLILGNHDLQLQKESELRDLFSSVSEYGEIRLFPKDGYFTRVCLFHYLIKSWNGKFHDSYMLHGHVHSSQTDKYTDDRSMDVGVDGSSDYAPYKLVDCIDLLEKRNKTSMEAEELFGIIIGIIAVSLYLLFFNFLIGGGLVDAIGGWWGVVLTVVGMGSALGHFIKDWLE